MLLIRTCLCYKGSLDLSRRCYTLFQLKRGCKSVGSQSAEIILMLAWSPQEPMIKSRAVVHLRQTTIFLTLTAHCHFSQKNVKYNYNIMVLYNQEQGSTQKCMKLYLKKSPFASQRGSFVDSQTSSTVVLQYKPVGNACNCSALQGCRWHGCSRCTCFECVYTIVAIVFGDNAINVHDLHPQV